MFSVESNEFDLAKIAGISAAEQAGLLSAKQAKERRWLTLYPSAPPSQQPPRLQPGLLDLLKPDTTICRCESVTLAKVNQAIDDGACDLTSLKMRTRLGMGSCQGSDALSPRP